MWPIVITAVVGTIVGTFVSRFLDRAVPPPPPAPLPPQKVILVDPNKVNVGDFVLVDVLGGNLSAVKSEHPEITGTVRMQVTNLNSFAGPDFIDAQFADTRLNFGNNSPIPVRRNGVVSKTL